MAGSTDRRGVSVSSLDVVWCPNPMRPHSDRQVRRLLLTGGDTLDSIVRRLALQPALLTATLNGMDVPRRRWRRKRVRSGDVLVLQQVARGVFEGATITAKLVMGANMGAMAATVLGTVLAFVGNVAVAMVAQSLIGSLTRSGGGRAQQQADDAPTAYSIEGGNNSARPYEPLILVLGEHRVFPDYASRPFAEFVPDPTTTSEVINNTPQHEEMLHPPFGFAGTPPAVIAPWVLIGEAGTPSDPDYVQYYGDTATRTYVRPRFLGGGDESITVPHTFVVMHPAAGDDMVTTYEDAMGMTDPSGPDPWLPPEGN